ADPSRRSCPTPRAPAGSAAPAARRTSVRQGRRPGCAGRTARWPPARRGPARRRRSPGSARRSEGARRAATPATSRATGSPGHGGTAGWTARNSSAGSGLSGGGGGPASPPPHPDRSTGSTPPPPVGGRHCRTRRLASRPVTAPGDVDPEVLDRLRPICRGLPESYEEPAWVGTRWRIRRRTFAHVLTVEPDRQGAHARAATLDRPACLL